MPATKKTMRHASGIKAHRQSLKHQSHNRFVKKTVRQAIRAAADGAAAKNPESGKLLSQAASTIDRAALRGIIHWKTAARRKSRLAKRTIVLLATVPAPAKA